MHIADLFHSIVLKTYNTEIELTDLITLFSINKIKDGKIIVARIVFTTSQYKTWHMTDTVVITVNGLDYPYYIRSMLVCGVEERYDIEIVDELR